MVKFTNEEICLMIIYSPGHQYGRSGLIHELENLLKCLVPGDRWLRKHLPILLDKLNSINDEEFDRLDLVAD